MAVACCREPFAGGPGCVCLLSCVEFLLGVMGVCECEMLDATAGGVSTTLDRALVRSHLVGRRQPPRGLMLIRGSCRLCRGGR